MNSSTLKSFLLWLWLFEPCSSPFHFFLQLSLSSLTIKRVKHEKKQSLGSKNNILKQHGLN